MSITDRIISRMTELKMTQKEFSKRSRIPESTISDWKKKGNTPGAEKLLDIAKALSVSVSYLLGEETGSVPNNDYIVSDEERLIIEAYRNSSDEIRGRIISYIKGLNKTIEKKNTDLVSEDSNVLKADSEFLIKKQLAYKLRRLSRLERLRLDENEHASGYNLHLLKYLDYVGLDRLEYIKKYLSNIQPFMISEIKSQEKFENAVCVLDNYYRISVYIKVDATRGEEIIVSFHESNKRGVAKRNNVLPANRYVYVFAESVGSFVENSQLYTINLFITRGVSTFPINVPATRYDDEGFMVNYMYINNALIGIANDYLQGLYTADIDFSSVELFTSLQQISFTSYGNDCFSNISLLIDSILIQKDYVSKRIADSALCIYCASLELLESDKKELLSTLQERFRVNSAKALPGILERVEINLKEPVPIIGH